MAETALETTISSSPTFGQLMDDVVRKIFAYLCIGDRVRMRLVSKSWRRMLMLDDIPMAPETPWLILSNDSYWKPEYFLSEICFSSFSEGRIYRFELPESIRFGYCCGCSRGWLLMALGGPQDLDLYNTNMFLWNPLSRQTRKLPPLSTLPFFNEFVGYAIQSVLSTDNISCLISNLQVFDVGTVECVVAIIFVKPFTEFLDQEPQHRLALCTPNDQSWTTLGGGEEEQHLLYYDIIFHNGKLYVSCENREEQALQIEGDNNDKIIREGRYSVRLTGGACVVEVDLLRFLYKAESTDPIRFSNILAEGCNIHEYLVESCSTGELLLVTAVVNLFKETFLRMTDVGVYQFTAAHNIAIEELFVFQTRAFEVRRITGDCCLEKVSGGIRDQSIFLGDNSLSLPTAYINQEADCINFATNSGFGVLLGEHEEFSMDRAFIVREQGVFNLQDNKIQISTLTNLRLHSASISGWFTPKLL